MKKSVCIVCLLTTFVFITTVAQAQDYTYTINDGEVTITRYIGSGGDVIIPDTIDGLPVTVIGDLAFCSCEDLVSVTVPNSVVAINHWAFYSCYNLNRINIGNNVFTINSDAFQDCNNLMEITVSTLNSFYSSTYGVLFNKNQTALIECPHGKTGDYIIPNSVVSIENKAFELCYNLTSVTISNGVVNIGDYAFRGCNILTSIVIPDSVVSIGAHAFEDCLSLTKVIVGRNVASIGTNAFCWCTQLAGIYFFGDAHLRGTDVFYVNYTTVYYLSGTTGWTNPWGGRPTVLWSLTPTVFLDTSVVGGHGTLAPNNGQYDINTIVTLEATPDDGYQVKAWTGTNHDELKTNLNTVTMTSDKVVRVEFEPIAHVSVVSKFNLFVLVFCIIVFFIVIKK